MRPPGSERADAPRDLGVRRGEQPTQGLYRAIWPVMQYGTIVTIPVLALIAFAFRRLRLGSE
jgi:hypothetical protein